MACRNVNRCLSRYEPVKAGAISGTVLVAYIAGNVESQHERLTIASDSYKAVQQVLKMYAQSKEADKTRDTLEIQRIVDLDAKKQLKKDLDEVLEVEKEFP